MPEGIIRVDVVSYFHHRQFPPGSAPVFTLLGLTDEIAHKWLPQTKIPKSKQVLLDVRATGNSREYDLRTASWPTGDDLITTLLAASIGRVVVADATTRCPATRW
jgi:hypothetical protein